MYEVSPVNILSFQTSSVSDLWQLYNMQSIWWYNQWYHAVLFLFCSILIWTDLHASEWHSFDLDSSNSHDQLGDTAQATEWWAFHFFKFDFISAVEISIAGSPKSSTVLFLLMLWHWKSKCHQMSYVCGLYVAQEGGGGGLFFQILG